MRTERNTDTTEIKTMHSKWASCCGALIQFDQVANPNAQLWDEPYCVYIVKLFSQLSAMAMMRLHLDDVTQVTLLRRPRPRVRLPKAVSAGTRPTCCRRGPTSTARISSMQTPTPSAVTLSFPARSTLDLSAATRSITSRTPGRRKRTGTASPATLSRRTQQTTTPTATSMAPARSIGRYDLSEGCLGYHFVTFVTCQLSAPHAPPRARTPHSPHSPHSPPTLPTCPTRHAPCTPPPHASQKNRRGSALTGPAALTGAALGGLTGIVGSTVEAATKVRLVRLHEITWRAARLLYRRHVNSRHVAP